MKYKIKAEVMLEGDDRDSALFQFTEMVRKSTDPSLGGRIKVYESGEPEFYLDTVDLDMGESKIVGWVDQTYKSVGIMVKESDPERTKTSPIVIVTPMDGKMENYACVEVFEDYKDISPEKKYYNVKESVEVLKSWVDNRKDKPMFVYDGDLSGFQEAFDKWTKEQKEKELEQSNCKDCIQEG